MDIEEDANATYRELAGEQPGETRLRGGLALSHERLGAVHVRQGHTRAAHDAFVEAFVDDQPATRSAIVGKAVKAGLSNWLADRLLRTADSDGLMMIDRLKSDLPDVPVILLTGVLFDPQVVSETLSKKITAYFQKTTPLARVLEEIRRLIGT